MKKEILFACLLSASLMSCECSYQYNVRVVNETGEDLNVAYKTINDRKGIVEKTVLLKAGEQKEIIQSTDIKTDEGCTGAIPEHCKYVAEYVNAVKIDHTPSKIKWCDKDIFFEKTDIQQAEFTIRYSAEDF